MDPAAAQADARTPLALNLTCNRTSWRDVADRGYPDEVADCRRVKAPVLVVHGAADPRPIEGVLLLIEALPSAELVTIAEAGHQPWREQPSRLRSMVRDFLGRQL